MLQSASSLPTLSNWHIIDDILKRISTVPLSQDQIISTVKSLDERGETEPAI